MNAFQNVEFNADTYAEGKRLAGNAWRNAEGKGDDFARHGLAALVTESLSAMGLCLSVYDEMEPKDAKGKPCEPKESEKAAGGVSVSSLRRAKGGEGARSCIEAVLYVYENRMLDAEAVAGFISNSKGAFRLFPLKAHLAKLKQEAAKAEKDALGGTATSEKEDVDTVADTDAPTLEASVMALVESLNSATGDELDNADAALQLLREALADAEARMAAVETLRTGTEG